MRLAIQFQRLVILVMCIAVFCGLTTTLAAQTESARISGLVTDPSGAVVAGAEILLQNIEQGTSKRVTTNNVGIYVLPSVMPGQYRISARKDGFKTIDVLGVVVNVQDRIEENFRLQTGSVSESVTVTGGAPLVNTEDASVSTVVDRNFAENLPMNGRSFQTLIQLTPGVVVTPSNFGDNGQFSVNGQRGASNYWMLDGVSANIGIAVHSGAGNGLAGAAGSFSALGGTNSLVSVDALQEFRIQTSTFAPEFGRTPGAQISILTRSGTNQWHGTAFDYFRNDKLDANDWFANSAGQPRPEERQNDFGGTVSGPILKNRTFFFFSYEGLRLRLPQTTLSTVPDLAARQNGLPALQPYLNAYPLPNGADDAVAGTAQFNGTYSVPAGLDAYSLRIDHRLGNKLNLFGRYNYSPSSIAQRGASSRPLSVVHLTRVTTQTATVGADWAFSPATANDFRFNYSHTSNATNASLDTFGGAVPLSIALYPTPYTSQDAYFAFGIFSMKNYFLDVGNVGSGVQRQFNVVDSLSVQKGSHSPKIGVDFRRLAPLYRPPLYQQENLFNDVPSAENGGLSFSYLQSNLNATFLFRNLGLYAQDTWRAARRLTLTYGLRWDVDFVPGDSKLPAVTGFNPTNLTNLGLAPTGTPPFRTRYSNVAPRIGVAYQLHESGDFQTVLRGGFGLFYDLATSEIGNTLAFGYPFAGSTFSVGGSFPLSPAAAAPPPILPPNPTNPPGVFEFVDPNLKAPYTVQWNVALEQALGTQQSISASYIGAAGRRLLQTGDVQSPNANIGAAQFVTNGGTSDYDALQVQFQRRLLRGLQVLSSYTWSHSIDTGSAGSLALYANYYLPFNGPNVNRGPSDFDVRNAFSAGVTYDIQAPKLNAFTNVILRGWSSDNFITARSAPPVDISAAATIFVFANGISGDTRPDVVPGQPFYLYGSLYPGGKAFNPAAFTNPPTSTNGLPARQGNVPRNFLRGFGAAQWDFAVHRDFPIRESLKLQFRAEMFNVLNHPNFGPPNGQFGLAGFGLSTQMLGQFLNGGTSGTGNLGGGAFSPLYQIGGPRSIQLALKLSF